MPFEYKTKVRLYHTDSAGFLFYSKMLEMAFDAFDGFLETNGVSIRSILHESEYLMPYIRVEADYLLPLYVDDRLKIIIDVEKIGDTSFVLRYDLLKNGKLAGCVKTVHVTVSKETGQKIPLPEEIRRALVSSVSS